MSEWQPIETAPRDGTQILALVASPYDDGTTYHLLTWSEGWASPNPRHPDQPACWWASENGANYHEPYVQKWMPLPAAVPLAEAPKIAVPEIGYYGFKAATFTGVAP